LSIDFLFNNCLNESIIAALALCFINLSSNTKKYYFFNNILYFCPVHGKWFEYLSDGDYRPEAAGQTIIDLWNTVSPPPVPELKSVTVDSKTTALLILDMGWTICKSTRYIASVSNFDNKKSLYYFNRSYTSVFI
jgi:hypothetical protein